MNRIYNIPGEYLVEKGLPIEFLNQKIKDEKCKEIFTEQVDSIIWKYQLVNDEDLSLPGTLTVKKGICIFEVDLKEEVNPELLTEIIASFIPRRMVIAFWLDKRLALSSYIPGEYGLTPTLQATDFYDTDVTKEVRILDFDEDSHKDYTVIQRRILNAIRERKKEALIEEAFNKVKIKKKKVTELKDFDLLFSSENLDKIREDAEYVEEQLRVIF